MITLFILLGLTYNTSVQQWEKDPYRNLWSMAEKAVNQGKPQTAVEYLRKIEKLARNDGNILELLDAMENISSNLGKYNWKENMEYYGGYQSFRDSVYSDLDSNIVKFAKHPKVYKLIGEKIRHLKSKADAEEPRDENKYKDIRKMCVQTIALFPKSAQEESLKSIIEEMDEISISSASNGWVYTGFSLDVDIYAKNISSAQVKILKLKEGYYINNCFLRDNKWEKEDGYELIKEFTVKDFSNRYNITETKKISVDFPDAGIYVLCLTNGKISNMEQVYVSKVAFAERNRENSYEFYAADAESGKPYENIGVTVFDHNTENNKRIFKKTKTISKHQYVQDGFTTLNQELFLPDSYSSMLRAETAEDKYASLSYIYKNYSRGDTEEQNWSRGLYIYTDRMLYKPSDTIRFKIIAYQTMNGKGYVQSGKTIKLSFYAPQTKGPVTEISLITNDMGSASGCFYIPADGKNGQYVISSDYVSKTVNVETYKRPSFYVDLTKNNEIYGFEDVVTQKGTIKSYAGIPISGASVSYQVWCSPKWVRWWNFRPFNDIKITEGKVYSGSEGKFDISFRALRPDVKDDAAALYSLIVTVTDPQGETHKDEIIIPVSDVPLNLTAAIEGEYMQDTIRIVNKNKAEGINFGISNLNDIPIEIKGNYEISRDGVTVLSGNYEGNKIKEIKFDSLASGDYTLSYWLEWRGRLIKKSERLALFSVSDTIVPIDDILFFYPVSGNKGKNIDFVLGTSEKDLYVEVEIFKKDRKYYRQAVHLQNETRRFTFPYKEEYGDCISLSVFGIRKSREYKVEYIFQREKEPDSFDLEISSFRDKTKPSSDESFTIKAPVSELTVSIFDVTTDRYGANSFFFRPFYRDYTYSPAINTNLTDHYSKDNDNLGNASKVMIRGYSQSSMEKKMYIAKDENIADSQVFSEEESVTEGQIGLREDFGETVAFYPHIRVPQSGNVEIKYKTKDALSTFRMLILAHTSDLRSANAEKTFVVQKELMVMPNLPLFVTEGDTITLKSKIINMGNSELKGKAFIEFYDALNGNTVNIKIENGKNKEKPLNLLAGAQSEVSWKIVVPSMERLGVKIYYSAGKLSDGENNMIEIVPALKEVTRAASFIIGDKKGRKYYEKELHKEIGAENPKIKYAEYSTLSALKEALKPVGKPDNENMISWLNVFYVNLMSEYMFNQDSNADGKITLQALRKLHDLQRHDGGFGWFPGMYSSDILTMLFLEKMYQLRNTGALAILKKLSDYGSGDGEILSEMINRGIGYIDSRIISLSEVKGTGFSNLIDYFTIRAEYQDIKMSPEVEKTFVKFIKDSQNEWQELSILNKTNLCTILLSCKHSAYSENSLKQRIEKISESLKDYAVINNTVGCYFPNAVMPYRGLMHTEIYAHAKLLGLFSKLGEKKIVKGLSQWLLLQKHNQAWENNMSTADAVYALIANKAEDLKFGAVYYTYKSAMKSIKNASNEIELVRKFMRSSTGEEIKDGEVLHLGEEIIVKYSIKNTENRSFVEMRTMRPACFYPVDERSGYMWGYYCEMKSSQTNYYFQLLPEEKSEIIERFFVTQEGVFNSGIAEIESLYATEYRGNTGATEIKVK